MPPDLVECTILVCYPLVGLLLITWFTWDHPLLITCCTCAPSQVQLQLFMEEKFTTITSTLPALHMLLRFRRWVWLTSGCGFTALLQAAYPQAEHSRPVSSGSQHIHDWPGVCTEVVYEAEGGASPATGPTTNIRWSCTVSHDLALHHVTC